VNQQATSRATRATGSLRCVLDTVNALSADPAEHAEPAYESSRRLTPAERHRLIAEAAYRRAERRGFAGDPLSDWLEAEREIDDH
jgi:hypothetical protein